jgi:pyruvate kinase
LIDNLPVQAYNWGMEYEIIATLGPASTAESVWQALLSAGATAFRLNTSHLSLDQLTAWLERLDHHFGASSPALVLDLQGSKWRLGTFAAFELNAGQGIRLVHAASAGNAGILPVPHSDFFRAAAQSSGEIVLNDAKVCLVLEEAGDDWLAARVTRGGEISSHKGITFTASEYRAENLSEKDRSILEVTRGLAWVRYAISYVRDAAEMTRYRALIQPGYLIAKLERGPAMTEAQLVAAAADEVWLCRGDLGAEVGLKEMAAAVARFSAQVSGLGVPAMLAGQVLEHMTTHPTPTRSEVCYLYDALSRGYQGCVLSDETAIGRYPVESCQTAAIFR